MGALSSEGVCDEPAARPLYVFIRGTSSWHLNGECVRVRSVSQSVVGHCWTFCSSCYCVLYAKLTDRPHACTHKEGDGENKLHGVLQRDSR